MYRKFNYFFSEQRNSTHTGLKLIQIIPYQIFKNKRGGGGLLIAYMPHSHIPKDDGEFSKIKMFNLKS